MSGVATSINAPAIPYSTLEPYWHWENNLLPVGMRRVTPNSPDGQRNLNERLYEVLGSRMNRAPFRLLERESNGIKGRIFRTLYSSETFIRTGRTDISSEKNMITWRTQFITKHGTMAANPEYLHAMRAVTAVWRFLHHEDVLSRIMETRRALRSEINLVEATTRQLASTPGGRPHLGGLTALFDEFDTDYWQSAVDHSQTWIMTQISTLRESLNNYTIANGQDHPERFWIEVALDDILIECFRHIVTLPDL